MRAGARGCAGVRAWHSVRVEYVGAGERMPRRYVRVEYVGAGERMPRRYAVSSSSFAVSVSEASATAGSADSCRPKLGIIRRSFGSQPT